MVEPILGGAPPVRRSRKLITKTDCMNDRICELDLRSRQVTTKATHNRDRSRRQHTSRVEFPRQLVFDWTGYHHTTKKAEDESVLLIAAQSGIHRYHITTGQTQHLVSDLVNSVQCTTCGGSGGDGSGLILFVTFSLDGETDDSGLHPHTINCFDERTGRVVEVMLPSNDNPSIVLPHTHRQHSNSNSSCVFVTHDHRVIQRIDLPPAYFPLPYCEHDR